MALCSPTSPRRAMLRHATIVTASLIWTRHEYPIVGSGAIVHNSPCAANTMTSPLPDVPAVAANAATGPAPVVLPGLRSNMTDRTAETKPQIYARIGGVLYLIIIA